MTLDPKALDAAARALSEVIEAPNPSRRTDAQIDRDAARAAVCAYLAVLGRDPRRNAAREARAKLHAWFGTDPPSYVRALVEQLDAALGEGDKP
jgi:hypothetical protein